MWVVLCLERKNVNTGELTPGINMRVHETTINLFVPQGLPNRTTVDSPPVESVLLDDLIVADPRASLLEMKIPTRPQRKKTGTETAVTLAAAIENCSRPPLFILRNYERDMEK